MREEYMKIALELAKKAEDRTYPNPMVGAVIVKKGKIVGKGYHKKAGSDHAEVSAIKDSEGKCKGADMYVTLEPCNNFGKTPPCTQAIIDAGIKKVYFAMKDPNKINRAGGISRLRKEGVAVEAVSECRDEVLSLNRKYIKYMSKKLPYVTVKLAQSLDGRIAARDGSSKWITNRRSRKYVRGVRSRFDAIMIGSNTLLKDDPFLLDEKRGKYNGYRIVVDSSLSIPENCNLVKTSDRSPVMIATTELAPRKKIDELKKNKNVEVIVFKSKNKKVPLKSFLRKLADRGIVNVLVEGGGSLAGSLIDGSLADEFMFFIAPKLIGGDYLSVRTKGVSNIGKAIELKDIKIEKFDEDLLIRGRI